EYSAFVYNADGEVVQVLRGSAPSTREPWMEGCITNSPALDPVALGVASSATYDDDGRLETSTDGRGQTHHVYYDGFGRVIRVVDPDGNEVRRGYDAMGEVIWEAAYGRPAPNATPLPPYGMPTITSPTLLGVNEYTYDTKGRPSTVNRWHFDENHRWIGDGRQTTTYVYDDIHRRVAVTDDAGFVTF